MRLAFSRRDRQPFTVGLQQPRRGRGFGRCDTAACVSPRSSAWVTECRSPRIVIDFSRSHGCRLATVSQHYPPAILPRRQQACPRVGIGDHKLLIPIPRRLLAIGRRKSVHRDFKLPARCFTMSATELTVSSGRRKNASSSSRVSARPPIPCADGIRTECLPRSRSISRSTRTKVG